MEPTKDIPPTTPRGGVLPALSTQQKETLLVLLVLNFAEENHLLNADQAAEARASLRALFLHATGAETMLRKVIGILQVNRALNRTFSDMARILEGIRKSHHALVTKHDALKQQLSAMTITPEENEGFIGPLLDYSNRFVHAVGDFDRQMSEYKEAKETESRSAHVYRLAQEARERLKRRFEQGGKEDSHEERQVKNKVIQTFNLAEAETDYQYSQASAKSARADVESSLAEFELMCQLAMKPEMRKPVKIGAESRRSQVPDIYAISLKGIETYPRLNTLLPAVQELLRLYQRSFGMFALDFEKFNNALGPMIENTEDYFSAKEQDEDVRTKQRKLEQIEALIAFIEEVSQLLRDGQEYIYPKFSSAVSGYITRVPSKWSGIAEQLLHMKVTAEAEFTTRLT